MLTSCTREKTSSLIFFSSTASTCPSHPVVQSLYLLMLDKFDHGNSARRVAIDEVLALNVCRWSIRSMLIDGAWVETPRDRECTAPAPLTCPPSPDRSV